MTKISSLQETGYYTLFIMYRMLRASAFNLLPKVSSITKEELANLTSFSQKEQLTIAQKSVTGLRESIDKGLWGIQGTMTSYYNTDVDLDYYYDVIPAFTDLGQHSDRLTVFEELANVDVIQQFDVLIKDLHYFVSEALVREDKMDYISNDYFLPLIYYGNSFAGTFRFPGFFNSVAESFQKTWFR